MRIRPRAIVTGLVVGGAAAALILLSVNVTPSSPIGTIGIVAPESPVTAPLSQAATSTPETAATSSPETVGAATETPETAPARQEETTVVEPLPYLPPPTVNLSGSTVGRQRVASVADLGDIQQIYYHTPTLSLFMAVVEPDGVRSVWRLPEDGKPERVLAAGSVGEVSIFGMSDGTMYIQLDNPSILYRSTDGFHTWQEVLRNYGSFWQMADDGGHVVYGTTHDWNTAILYRSLDGGLTWGPYVDFQKLFPQYAVRYDQNDSRFLLRHLHGVVYDQTSHQLLVGTGDVARNAYESPDDGETWQKIWDEGFTSAVRMSVGDRWLLGADQLHNHGIALYDARNGTTQEMWNPIKYDYAGYIYSMLNVNGIYYAGIHTEANEVDKVVPKFGVIVSPNGYEWYRFLEWGPLDHHARTNVWLAQAPTVVYLSVNGSLYAFRPLDAAWFDKKEKFQ